MNIRSPKWTHFPMKIRKRDTWTLAVLLFLMSSEQNYLQSKPRIVMPHHKAAKVSLVSFMVMCRSTP